MGPSPAVYARNCQIVRLDKDTCRDFLQQNHYLGPCSDRYRYGLVIRRSTGKNEQVFPPGTLVAVGTFSNARRMRNGLLSYEWLRYASLQGLRVVGGMSRILHTFVQEKQPGDVMTYADCQFSDGSAFVQLGFVQEEIVEKQGFKNIKLRKIYG
ncbi:MAG: hypothetical protein ACI3ZK_07850 [Candidatus Cryptobacteroides sp.]